MSKPVPVQIVRPHKSLKDFGTEFATSMVVLAIRAWVVMLVVPLVGFTPGYWQTVALVYAFRMLIVDNGWNVWTAKS